MSVPTLADLLTVRTQDEWTAIALAQLQGRNFPTTDWTSTSPERAMIETDTACLADQSIQIPLIVQLVLVQAALTGTVATDPATPALKFLAFNFYDLTAYDAGAAIGNLTLTCAAAAGPFTIAIGQLIAVSDDGLLYTNLTGGTLSPGGTLSLSFQCLTAGIAGNVGNGTITTLQTPLPGVTIANDPGLWSGVSHLGSGTGTVVLSATPTGSHSYSIRVDTDGDAGVATTSTSVDGGAYGSNGSSNPLVNLGGHGGTATLTDSAISPSFVAGDVYTFSSPGTWLTTQGTDAESQQSLAARILARWPALSAVPTEDVYSVWAKESAPGQVTRVLVETDPAVAATVNIYIAGPSAPSTAAQINSTQNYIDARAPLTDLPVVYAASTEAITITANATYPIGRVGGHADLDAAIVAYVTETAIGGTIETAQIVALAMKLNAAGVATGAVNIIDVDVGNGANVDKTLSSHAIPSPVTNSIVWTAV